MTSIGAVHLIFTLVAIGAGAVVVLLPKGTRWHRTFGHAYAMAMVGVVVTAFSLYNLTGSFGPFHFAALVASVTLAGGLYSVLRRRPKNAWIEAHATWMSWSYIGLMAALAAETLTRFVTPRAAPFLEGNELWGVFWISVVVASLGVLAIGARFVKTWLPDAIRKTPHAIRRERQRLRDVEVERGAEAITDPLVDHVGR